jgi:hypothetical protein
MAFTAEDISWANCVSTGTDGSAALTEYKKVLPAEVQQICPDMNFIHCIIRTEA